MDSSQTLECSNLPVAAESDKRVEWLQRAQWLRAAILGANDGLLSTTSLMLGVGAVKDDKWSMILSGLAGAVAGACSMAVGEFVSVSTQRDIEEAIVTRCCSKPQLGAQPDHHVLKLDISTSGPTIEEPKPKETNLGRQPTERMSPVITYEPKSRVAKAVTKLEEDQRDEALPNPYKAAAASALAFLCGSIVPLASAACVAQEVIRVVLIAVVTSIALVLSGGFGAYLGGSQVRLSALRVLFGGWIAMGITYGLLKPLGRSMHEGGHNND